MPADPGPPQPPEEIAGLQQAIDRDDLDDVRARMTANPALHRAPMGYGLDGPLTWVAECRRQGGAPSAARLAIAAWMLDHGSDVHQGGNGPLMRAALAGTRIPMMALLVARGANVNALWHKTFPVIFAPCESVDPAALTWLLDHGADPNPSHPDQTFRGTALDYLVAGYERAPALRDCIDLLVAAGGVGACPAPVLDVIRGDTARVAAHLDADAALVSRRFADLDFGATGGRRMTLRGATLLHVAAEYGQVDVMALLVERGADVNARAAVDEDGVGGQTPIFHAATQFRDRGVPALRWLEAHGADLTARARVPGHYERPGEILEGTALDYARAIGAP